MIQPPRTETVDFPQNGPSTGSGRAEELREIKARTAQAEPFDVAQDMLVEAGFASLSTPSHQGGSWAGRARLAILLAFVLALVSAPGVRAADIDWAAVEHEAADFLSRYIQIDTTNPPGNETVAAQFLADRFRDAGIEAEVFEAAPGRGSVLARLKGKGGAPPLILLNHLDVVPAVASEWKTPPFAGVAQNGFVFGRGALDCKGVGTIDALAMLLLKRHGPPLRRDVIFLGTADEETGGTMGAGWMVANQFDKFSDAEFVLNEGGHIHVMPNGTRAYEVAVSEKTPCWIRLTATGKAGHGSAPPRETAVTELVRALHRLRSYQPAPRVTPEVQAYFAALAPLQVGAQRGHYADLRGALGRDSFRQEFLANGHNAALVQNTLTPTVLMASQKTNVIPRTATAELDCRLLSDESPRAFLQTVTELIDDPGMRIEVLLNFPPSASRTDTALFDTIVTAAGPDHGTVLPSVLTGFTDSHYFRDKGIVSYGFVPFVLNDDDTLGEHGINERLSTANLRDGTRRLVELLQVLDGNTTNAPRHAARD